MDFHYETNDETVAPGCMYVWSGYPHPGCAEFAPPDEWHCPKKATHRMTLVGPYGPELLLACCEHADDMADPDGVDVSDVVLLDSAWRSQYRRGAALAEMVAIDTELAVLWMHEGVLAAPDLGEGFVAGWTDVIARRCNALLGTDD